MVKRPKGMRLGRLGARTASKVQERQLVSRTRELREHPEYLIPECSPDCRKNPFEKIAKQLRKIQSYKDDRDALVRFVKGGDQLARAYAAALLIAIDGKAPILSSAKYPWGEVTYARKERVKQDQLVGVQNFKDPQWRLLSISHIALKKKVYVYSVDDGMLCTGKEPEPPKAFIANTLRRLKYSLASDSEVYSCGHCGKEHGRPYLEISWLSAGIKIRVCSLCSSKGRNSMGIISQGVIGPKLGNDYRVDFKPLLKCEVECSGCSIEAFGIDQNIIEAFKAGSISDRELVTREMDHVRGKAKEASKRLYILGNQCFGDDHEAFIDSLDPSPEESIALKAVLEKNPEPVVAEEMSPGRLLANLWEEYGRLALLSVVGDKKIAGRMFKEHDIEKLSPSQILSEAKFAVKTRDLDAVLPKYGELPAVAVLADRVARTYMVAGEKEAVALLQRYQASDTKEKSVAYAFLMLWGQEKGLEWKFSQNEREFAGFLLEFARNLVEVGTEGYHDALQALLQASGSTEEIRRA